MTSINVQLPFELTREHMLLLRAAERKIDASAVKAVMAPNHPENLTWNSGNDVSITGMILLSWDNRLFLTPFGRAILEQCPPLWKPAELEAKLREMAAPGSDR